MAQKYEKVTKVIEYFYWNDVQSEVERIVDQDLCAFEYTVDGSKHVGDFWGWWLDNQEQDYSNERISESTHCFSSILERQVKRGDEEWEWIIPILQAFVQVLGEDAQDYIQFQY